jgi:hypothetical protein
LISEQIIESIKIGYNKFLLKFKFHSFAIKIWRTEEVIEEATIPVNFLSTF